MAKTKINYIIENNIPVRGLSRFDTSIPEYETMAKMKPGQSFAFNEERIDLIDGSRLYLRRLNKSSFLTRKEIDKDGRAIAGMFRIWKTDKPRVRRKPKE